MMCVSLRQTLLIANLLIHYVFFVNHDVHIQMQVRIQVFKKTNSLQMFLKYCQLWVVKLRTDFHVESQTRGCVLSSTKCVRYGSKAFWTNVYMKRWNVYKTCLSYNEQGYHCLFNNITTNCTKLFLIWNTWNTIV